MWILNYSNGLTTVLLIEKKFRLPENEILINRMTDMTETYQNPLLSFEFIYEKGGLTWPVP